MDLSRLKTTRTIANLKAGRTDWYRIKAQAGVATQVMVYDEIGYWGVSAQDFINDLKQVDGPIDLHLNSPGGEVFDGIAIFQFLSGRGGVTTYVDSLAASIASVIAMAGTEIVMGRNASMMIHDGFGLCIGNAADMHEQADLLDRVSDNIASIYADRTGKPVADWRAAMLAETWYIGQEAVDAGLADRLAPLGSAAGKGRPAQDEPDSESSAANRMAAHFDLSIFRNAPAAMRNQAEQTVPEPTPPDPAPPTPVPEPATPEAPALTDRGFVVPGASAEPTDEPEAGPEPTTPADDAAPETTPGTEVLAQIRADIRAIADAVARLEESNVPEPHEPEAEAPHDGPDAAPAAAEQAGPLPHDQNKPSITFEWHPSMTAAFKEAMQ